MSTTSVYNERDFEAKTTKQLAQFYILGQTVLHIFQSRFDPETLQNHNARLPHYTMAEQTWHQHPEVNPVDYPVSLTSQAVAGFYKKCTDLLEKAGEESTAIQLI